MVAKEEISKVPLKVIVLSDEFHECCRIAAHHVQELEEFRGVSLVPNSRLWIVWADG